LTSPFRCVSALDFHVFSVDCFESKPIPFLLVNNLVQSFSYLKPLFFFQLITQPFKRLGFFEEKRGDDSGVTLSLMARGEIMLQYVLKFVGGSVVVVLLSDPCRVTPATTVYTVLKPPPPVFSFVYLSEEM
jgi:hypothetical protein